VVSSRLSPAAWRVDLVVLLNRMQPALNAPSAINIPAAVDDANFKKLVAIIRCAVPYTGEPLGLSVRGALRDRTGAGALPMVSQA
jgi:hypothetical protein